MPIDYDYENDYDLENSFFRFGGEPLGSGGQVGNFAFCGLVGAGYPLALE